MAANYEGWETRLEIDKALTAVDPTATHDQLARWRREGLLPQVEQVPLDFWGSEVRYPPGTARQIAAIGALLKKKRNFDYVGWDLWWYGFPVDERYWKPHLFRAAKQFDRALLMLSRLVDLDDRTDSNTTVFDRIGRPVLKNNIFSRVLGRLKDDNNLATLFTVLTEIAQGDFEGFAAQTREGEPDYEAAIFIKALALDCPKSHKIIDQRLNQTAALLPAFKTISIGLKRQSLSTAVNLPATELEEARNDVRNALFMGLALYEATEWIFKGGAFGLRFVAWIAKRAPLTMKAGMIAPMVAVRQVPNDFYSSEEIASMASKAIEMRNQSLRLRYLWKNDPRFKSVLSPKSLRSGFSDVVAFKQLLKNIEAARIDYTYIN